MTPKGDSPADYEPARNSVWVANTGIFRDWADLSGSWALS